MAVGRDHGAAVGTPHAGRVGEAAARLLDDDLHGGQVPNAHAQLDSQIDGSLRNEHVLPEIAHTPCHPRTLRERDESIADALFEEALGARVAHDRVLDPCHAGDMNRLPVEVGALAASAPPAPVQCRCADDADDELAVALEPDQRCEHRNAAHEIPRPVDRIDDPPNRAGPGLTALLAENCVARPLRVDTRA